MQIGVKQIVTQYRDKIGCTSAESSSKLDFMRSVCTIFAQRQVDNQNKTYDNNTYNTELCGTERGAFP